MKWTYDDERVVMMNESSASYEDTCLAILDTMPVSVWVEDWSPVKAMIDGLDREGVMDWRQYFEQRPEETIKAANLIDVIDVNRATLALYGANCKTELIDSTEGENMAGGELTAFREQLIAFAEGNKQFSIDAEEVTMDDDQILTRIHAGIAPACHDDWSIVYCMVEEKNAEADSEAFDLMELVSGGDMAYWETVKDSTRAEDFESYLETFPSGIFAALARRELVQLGATLESLDLKPSLIIPHIGMDFDQLHERACRNTEAKAKAVKS